MKNALDFGFQPGASARHNAIALQQAVSGGGVIEITQPGIYDMDQTVVLESHTTLRFAEGVQLRRQQTLEQEKDYGYTFVNAGAYTRQYDTDITIEGLNLICNGVDTDDFRHAAAKAIPGLRGFLAFFYIQNLAIRNFVCLDLLTQGFGIHICTFDNILVENVHIEGKKDGVHLGRGKNFIIRHGKFETYDDPIALNAHDYATSNPQLGWIENGLIEDCWDMDADSTVGFFCRILAGSWCDWREGMEVQHSDSVVSHGRVYRVLAKPDGTIYRSVTAPTHAEGTQVLDDIPWVMVQDDVQYSCGCRNIRFKDIHLCKRRSVGLSIHFDDDDWSRSVYPGSVMPVQENIVFEGLHVENQVDVVLSSRSPIRHVAFENSDLAEGHFDFPTLPREGLVYPEAYLHLSNVTFSHDNGPQITSAPNRKVRVVEGNRS